MQPCSPPYLPSFQPSNTTSTTANNSNAPSNLFNNGNSASASASYQTENDNSQPKSNGSSSTNQSELVHHPATNSKTNDKVQDYKSSSSNNLTPKPPKKRYLENGEFKEPSMYPLFVIRTIVLLILGLNFFLFLHLFSYSSLYDCYHIIINNHHKFNHHKFNHHKFNHHKQ